MTREEGKRKVNDIQQQDESERLEKVFHLFVLPIYFFCIEIYSKSGVRWRQGAGRRGAGRGGGVMGRVSDGALSRLSVQEMSRDHRHPRPAVRVLSQALEHATSRCRGRGWRGER